MPSQVAIKLYGEARVSLDNPLGVGWLALRLLGSEALQWSTTGPDVLLVPDPWRLLCHRGSTDDACSIGIARGLAAWWSESTCAMRGPAFLELLAEELLLPMPAFRVAADRLRGNVRKLAAEFVAPPHIIALRLSRIAGPRRLTGEYQRFRAAS